MSTIVTSSAILKDAVPIAYSEDTKKYYSIRDEDNEDKRVTSIDATNLQTIPFLDLTNPKNIQRSGVYISAPSGAGKSTIAINLVRQYLKILKNRKVPPVLTYDESTGKTVAKKRERRVIMFTASDTIDPAFDEFKDSDFFHCISINGSDETYLDTKVEHLANSIVIFDDYIGMNKKYELFTLKFINTILEHSRKIDVQVIIITHQTMDFNKTRNIIFECDTYILAPSASQHSVRTFLKSYGDISKEQINMMISKSNRRFEFLVFHKSCPIYFQTKRNITLLN